MARVWPRKEAALNQLAGDWTLWFQWCCYDLETGVQHGYRFIWKTPDGALQAARGQARIPSLKEARDLMAKADAEGWGDRDGDVLAEAAKRLEAHGLVVNLLTRYVGWPNKEAAANGQLTPSLMEDEKLVREWA